MIIRVYVQAPYTGVYNTQYTTTISTQHTHTIAHQSPLSPPPHTHNTHTHYTPCASSSTLQRSQHCLVNAVNTLVNAWGSLYWRLCMAMSCTLLTRAGMHASMSSKVPVWDTWIYMMAGGMMHVYSWGMMHVYRMTCV